LTHRRTFFPDDTQIQPACLGFHPFANGKALFFFGQFFTGTAAQPRLSAGREIIVRELGRRILADAANTQRSPMNHAIILKSRW